MDPPKLPMIRAQIWTLMQSAQMHKDLGLETQPGDEQFDDFIMHVDGWLCEVKDAQIRDGLHILGQAPAGEARVNLVLAILRATQIWGGRSEEHTSELQSLMRISYAVFCLKKKNKQNNRIQM